MIKLTVLSLSFLTVVTMVAFNRQREVKPFDLKKYKEARLIRCSPDFNSLSQLLDENEIPPMPEAGVYKWMISTKSDSAQFYFNQGINMYYGFHIIEALASFKKASRFDPNCGIIWWAQALSYGPNINDVGYAASPEALKASKKAMALSVSASPFEKQLIDAMGKRYSEDTTASRASLNQAYADAMKGIYEEQNHSDAAALYSDALMVQHPWDFWTPAGAAKTWTPAIRSVLEKGLASAPHHPGINHYYIHVMEASPYPFKALPSADRLGKLTPGLSHMVHMPSHIYLRTGQYDKGIAINKLAVNHYLKYATLFPAVQENFFIYQLHNQHMLVNCALMAGRYIEGFNTSTDFEKSLDTSLLSLPAPMGNAVQYVAMSSVFVNVHFAKWEQLLKLEAPPTSQSYASILYHFGKGMAHAGLKETNQAKNHLSKLHSFLSEASLAVPFGPYSPPIEGAKTASELLEGWINLKTDNVLQAIVHLKKSSAIEEAMVYNEPRDWLINPRQYLGAAYLKAKQWSNAENTFKKDLNQNGQNVWSLQGLLQALKAQQKRTEANIINSQWRAAIAKGDSSIVKSFFN